MPRIVLMGSIRQQAGGIDAIVVEGATVRAAIASLEKQHPALKSWVADEQGALRRHVKLFRAGEAVTLDVALAPGDDLYIVGAVSGG
jgi:molybdopterin converting factor small subunit